VVDKIFEERAAFRQFPPLSLRFVRGTGIMPHRKETVVLFVGDCREDPNCVRVIDPRSGDRIKANIEKLAMLPQKRAEEAGREAALIEPTDIRGMTAVCFASSGSMKAGLDNKSVPTEKGSIPDPHRHCTRIPVVAHTLRMTIALQCMESFSNRVCALRIPMLLGLVEFNNTARRLGPLLPLSADFERASEKLKLESNSVL
jgi:hypothetical protein